MNEKLLEKVLEGDTLIMKYLFKKTLELEARVIELDKKLNQLER